MILATVMFKLHERMRNRTIHRLAHKPTEDPHTSVTPTTPNENEIVFHAPTPSLSGQSDYEGVTIQSAAELEAYYIAHWHEKASKEDMCATVRR